MTLSAKKTEAGIIPEEWESRRLADLLDKSRHIRYGIVQPGKFDSSGCLMLRSQDSSKGWAGPDNMHRVNRALENQYKNARLHHDDLVITVVGAGIGQVVSVPAWLDGAILSRSTARIAVDQEKAVSSFVSALLESPVGKRQILDCQKEGAQPVVSCLDLAKFVVPVPPLPEQRAIAATLSDIDALLAALDRLIAKKRDLKQAAMQQLLSCQTRLQGFDGEWEVKSVAEIASVSKGTQLHSNEANVDGQFPHFNGGISASGYTDRANTPADTIVISEGGNSCGYVQFISRPFWCGGHCYAVVPRSTDNLYLYHALKHHQTAIMGLRVGSGLPNVQKKALAEFSLSVPVELTEQAAIAAVLCDMDSEIDTLEARRNKTHRLKQGMMQELLTGRTRLV